MYVQGKSQIFALCLLCFANLSWAQKGVHATLDEVMQQAFPNSGQEYQSLWLPNEVKERFKEELGFELSGLRQRYWQDGNRTLWILDEIGKEHPITFAYIIENSQIHSAIVMEYRESRGGEIRHEFFRAQFDRVRLDDGSLDQQIDGITGATLSVRAMTKTAKQALWLDREATSPQPVVSDL